MRNAPAPKKTQLRAWSLNVKFHFAFINPDCWGKNYLCSNMVPQMVRNSVSFTVCIQSNLIYVQSTYIYINLSIYIYIYILFSPILFLFSLNSRRIANTRQIVWVCLTILNTWHHQIFQYVSCYTVFLLYLFPSKY